MKKKTGRTSPLLPNCRKTIPPYVEYDSPRYPLDTVIANNDIDPFYIMTIPIVNL